MCPIQDLENAEITGRTYLYSVEKSPILFPISAYAGTLALGVGTDPSVKGHVWQKQDDGLTNNWTLISTNAIHFSGTWDANANIPDLTSLTPNPGDFWIVTVAGSTSLGGITDWHVHDWAVYIGAGVWDKIDNNQLVTSVNGMTGDVVLTTLAVPVGRTLFVDKSRTDIYTPNGNITRPYKTIQDAVNYVASVGVAGQDWCITICTGQYQENVLLESPGLHMVSFEGLGVVGITPVAGNSLQSTSNNGNLVKFHCRNIEFTRPVVITGPNAGNTFNDVWFQDCKFIGASVITATCINNLSLHSGYFENNVVLNNVNFFYNDSCRMNGTFSMTCDSTTNAPSAGFNCTSMINGIYEMGAVTLAKIGTATGVVVFIGSRANSSSNTITVPAGWTLQAYASFIRGNVTNNGTFQMRNAFVEGTLTNTGTLTLNQPISQIKNDSTVTGTTAKDALEYLNKGRCIEFSIDNGAIPIPVGFIGFIIVPFEYDLGAWTISAKQVGNISIDIWVCPFAGLPPTLADSITNGHYVELAAQQGAKDEDISDWSTRHIAKWSAVGFNVNALPLPDVTAINLVLSRA